MVFKIVLSLKMKIASRLIRTNSMRKSRLAAMLALNVELTPLQPPMPLRESRPRPLVIMNHLARQFDVLLSEPIKFDLLFVIDY